MDLYELVDSLMSLDKFRDESICVEVTVPGQRWEIEFMYDGTIDIEKFITTAIIDNGDEIEVLFRDFSD